MLADRDHVLFEYLEKENGKTVQALFRGYSGYVQADAKSVFNLIFADAGELEKKAPDLEHDGCERVEVGCWYHARRRFWEATVAKSHVVVSPLFSRDDGHGDRFSQGTADGDLTLRPQRADLLQTVTAVAGSRRTTRTGVSRGQIERAGAVDFTAFSLPRADGRR